MFADEIRRAIEAATRITLPQVTALLWRAYADEKVTEAEAETLSGLIEARTLSAPRRGDNLPARQVLRSPVSGSSPDPASAAYSGSTEKPQNSPRRPGVGSRPRTGASMERRRRWAASGRLPPGLAARFTLAEQAVLALVAAEVVRRKDCRLSVPNLAAVTGVAETTVRNAIREARKLGLLTVEERQITGFRNDTNIVRIVSPEWTAWLRLARTRDPLSRLGSSASAPPAQGGGCKSANRTSTEVLVLSESGKTEPKKGCRQAAGDLDRSGQPRIRADRGAGGAMR
ncbi:helix-turn-helix domain-containing protein [Methylobacterium sp. E-066]|uniref:helix-turn-helix domain-containing protein n=1 Tax=Methylobacterium sp. E-066 TaxID=2836584 RepID=UPI001FB8C70F|nr:helix-turn-helix domain-containing protein [Methylobacterium sp. E-066]MCJ2139489.1 helix-turn-helix domain-containing protein [Methylobacterium sp. E-066]